MRRSFMVAVLIALAPGAPALPSAPSDERPPFDPRSSPEEAGARAGPRVFVDPLADPRLATIARDFIRAAPLADPGDTKARDEAARALSRCLPFLDACAETIDWGGYDPIKGYDPGAYVLTRFSPMVWAQLYCSQFMFTGDYSVRREGRFHVLELGAKYRDQLDPGDYPYPLWHSPTKWQLHLNVDSILLIMDEGRIVAAFRKPKLDMSILPDRRWDGRWHWTTEEGVAQPRVTFFEYLLSPDNPHLASLNESYRQLEAKFRAAECMACHSPDNPSNASPLVLLIYPNQALGLRHANLEILKRNEMPPRDPITGAPAGIADQERLNELIALSERFARIGDEAMAFEMRKIRPAGALQEGDAQPEIGPQGGAANGGQAMRDDATPWRIVSDEWFRLTLAGIHAGWSRIVRESDGDRLRTSQEMSIRFERAGTRLDVDNWVQWVEREDGTPLSLAIAKRNKNRLTHFDIGDVTAWDRTRDGDPVGLLTSRRSWEFNGPVMTSAIEGPQGQFVRTERSAPGGPWLPPAAMERFIATRIADGARLIEYGTLDAPDELRYVSTRSTLIGDSIFAVDGRIVPVSVWQTRTSVHGSTAISHYLPDGTLVYSAIDLGLGILETKRVPRELAMPGGGTPADGAVAAMSRPPTVLARGPVHDGPVASYLVRLREGSPPMLPSAGAQTVLATGNGELRVVVDATASSPASSVDVVERQLIDRSPWIGLDDPLVVETAARALRQTEGFGDRAMALSSWRAVRDHFREHPAAAQPASARGELESRLLRDVLRVHRLASRRVGGLTRVACTADRSGEFVWSHWVQVMADGKWIDLDPTSDAPFDGGHILCALPTTIIGDGDPDPTGFEQLLADLDVQIESPQ